MLDNDVNKTSQSNDFQLDEKFEKITKHSGFFFPGF
jgi:hypothetical protein